MGLQSALRRPAEHRVATTPNTLNLAIAEGVHVITRGHLWLNHELIPAIAAVSKHKAHARAVSHACYVVGDVYDFLAVPSRSAEWYRRAIEADDEHWEAWRELGNQLCDLGRRREALACLRRACFLSNDPLAIADLAAAERQPATRTRETKIQTQLAKSRQALASGRHTQALASLPAKSNNTEVLLHRARIHAARSNFASYCELWHQLRYTPRPFVTSIADWHYLPTDILQYTSILNAWLQTVGNWNIEMSVMPWHAHAFGKTTTRHLFKKTLNHMLRTAATPRL